MRHGKRSPLASKSSASSSTETRHSRGLPWPSSSIFGALSCGRRFPSPSATKESGNENRCCLNSASSTRFSACPSRLTKSGNAKEERTQLAATGIKSPSSLSAPSLTAPRACSTLQDSTDCDTSATSGIDEQTPFRDPKAIANRWYDSPIHDARKLRFS